MWKAPEVDKIDFLHVDGKLGQYQQVYGQKSKFFEVSLCDISTDFYRLNGEMLTNLFSFKRFSGFENQ